MPNLKRIGHIAAVSHPFVVSGLIVLAGIGIGYKSYYEAIEQQDKAAIEHGVVVQEIDQILKAIRQDKPDSNAFIRANYSSKTLAALNSCAPNSLWTDLYASPDGKNMESCLKKAADKLTRPDIETRPALFAATNCVFGMAIPAGLYLSVLHLAGVPRKARKALQRFKTAYLRTQAP